MEILRFKELGIQKVLSLMQFGCLSSHWQFLVCTFWKCRQDSNAVDLVLGECQISMATYLRGYLPSYKVVWQCIGNWQCYATLKSSRTDTQTNSLNAIVSQPLRGSTNKKSNYFQRAYIIGHPLNLLPTNLAKCKTINNGELLWLKILSNKHLLIYILSNKYLLMSYFIVLTLYLPNAELISIFLLNTELRTPHSGPLL